MFTFRSLLIPLSLGLSTGVSETMASGTYPPAPPRLDASITREVDSEAYNLGKLIFVGRAKLSGSPQNAALIEQNRSNLTALVSKIPARAQRRISVESLANELKAEETDALLYYLKLRFRLLEVST